MSLPYEDDYDYDDDGEPEERESGEEGAEEDESWYGHPSLTAAERNPSLLRGGW